MVDTAQSHAYHQNHRQFQGDGQIREVGLVRQRYAPAACAFNQGEVGTLLQNLPHRCQQPLYAQHHAGLTGCQVWSNGRLESERVDLFIRQLDRALCNQCQGIVIAQPFRAGSAPGRYRFGAQGAQPCQLCCMQQSGSHGGLADIGIGACDEIGWAHLTPLLSTAFAVHRRPPDRSPAGLVLGETVRRPAKAPASVPVRSALAGDPG
ncbi:hypothetical protein D3C77_447490 [compost metagenome]